MEFTPSESMTDAQRFWRAGGRLLSPTDSDTDAGGVGAVGGGLQTEVGAVPVVPKDNPPMCLGQILSSL